MPTRKTLTIAERARLASEYVKAISDAATGAESATQRINERAAQHLDTYCALQIKDAIGYQMIHVLEWVERRRGVETANSLRAEMVAILNAMDKPQESTPVGALILDLFMKARTYAYKLQKWADDIEDEEAQRLQVRSTEYRPPESVSAQESITADLQRPAKPNTNRRHGKGDAEELLNEALIAHHKYDNGSCGNFEPIGCREVASQLKVGITTASDFFTKVFGGYSAYEFACRDGTRLIERLKIIARDYSDGPSFGRTPPGEGFDERE